MTYKFTILGRLPNLNDYLASERIPLRTKTGKFTTRGNKMKHDAQDNIIKQISRDLKGLKITNPVFLHYKFYEENQKRDLDNIASFAMKVTQDSLVLSGVLPNDGWTWIKGFTCDFGVDSINPRIEVKIEEVV